MMKRVFLVLTFLALFSIGKGAAEEWAPVLSENSALSFQKKMQQNVNIDNKNADLVNIMRSFAWTYKLNIVTSPDVKGKIIYPFPDLPR